jgi:hypothetical protein
VYCVQLSTDLLSCLATQIVKWLGSWIWDHCSLEIEMLVYSLYIWILFSDSQLILVVLHPPNIWLLKCKVLYLHHFF